MAIQVLTPEQQSKGEFNGGEITERRPVVIMEGAGLRPYSNLFYWANARSEGESLIGEHPHQGFEILSFVLEGEIVHYDSHYKKWIPLPTGAVQIIRSGSGISHAEKFLPGTNMFQIWFDPDLQGSLNKAPSYNDYHPDNLPVKKDNGASVKTWVGEDSPVELDTPGVMIKQYTFGKDSIELPADKDTILSAFMLKGQARVKEMTLHERDFFKAEGEEKPLRVEGMEDENQLFVISTPANPRYVTYANRVKKFHGSF